MKESIALPKEVFKVPDIQSEKGEFERVAETFDLDPDILMFLATEEGKLQELSEGLSCELENTDSNKFEKGDWEEVGKWAREYGRDWVAIKEKVEQGVLMEAPIIMKYGTVYHLVSGNTRLMVTRALGVTPKALFFEFKKDRTDDAL